MPSGGYRHRRPDPRTAPWRFFSVHGGGPELVPSGTRSDSFALPRFAKPRVFDQTRGQLQLADFFPPAQADSPSRRATDYLYRRSWHPSYYQYQRSTFPPTATVTPVFDVLLQGRDQSFRAT